jgi:hypothetical protein
MALDLQSLDVDTRPYMLEEFELDRAAGLLFKSRHFSPQGELSSPELLKSAIVSGSDDTLADELGIPGMFVLQYQKRKPQGGFTMAKVPINAAAVYAQSEFNRFYIRGLCRRVVAGGGGQVEVYRARASSRPRPESEALIGTRIDAASLLEDLRAHIGEAPTLLPEVNSGLSVRLI